MAVPVLSAIVGIRSIDSYSRKQVPSQIWMRINPRINHSDGDSFTLSYLMGRSRIE